MEWIIVVAAAATLAAASAAALQRTIDEGIEARSASGVRVWEADTAAAEIERSARDASRADPQRYDEAPFRHRCNGISRLFADVVSDARWIPGPGRADLPRCDVRLR